MRILAGGAADADAVHAAGEQQLQEPIERRDLDAAGVVDRSGNRREQPSHGSGQYSPWVASRRLAVGTLVKMPTGKAEVPITFHIQPGSESMPVRDLVDRIGLAASWPLG